MSHSLRSQMLVTFRNNKWKQKLNCLLVDRNYDHDDSGPLFDLYRNLCLFVQRNRRVQRIVANRSASTCNANICTEKLLCTVCVVRRFGVRVRCEMHRRNDLTRKLCVNGELRRTMTIQMAHMTYTRYHMNARAHTDTAVLLSNFLTKTSGEKRWATERWISRCWADRSLLACVYTPHEMSKRQH